MLAFVLIMFGLKFQINVIYYLSNIVVLRMEVTSVVISKAELLVIETADDKTSRSLLIKEKK